MTSRNSHFRLANESDVTYTDNYIWSESDSLGRGATSLVYKALHRGTGEAAAIKMFTENLQYLSQKESEILVKLKHENLVRMIGIELIKNSRTQVLIMEYCSGGSLYNILDEPENLHGLGEDEFLLVLFDIVSAMQYLRQCNILHRDIKPGNIMKHVTNEGLAIFKMIDLGAARGDLPPGGEFETIQGTPEYLHPYMYKRALIQPRANTSHQGRFRESCDLWSLGATLYHSATGSLPFRPFNGRSDYNTMHIMTTRKAPGMISGTQLSNSGDIIWQDKLPDTCRLSNWLRQFITRILGGLMEVNDDHAITFPKLFATVALFRRSSFVPLFVAPTCTLDRFYILPPQDRTAADIALPEIPGTNGPETLLDTSSLLPQVKRYLSKLYQLDAAELDLCPSNPDLLESRSPLTKSTSHGGQDSLPQLDLKFCTEDSLILACRRSCDSIRQLNATAALRASMMHSSGGLADHSSGAASSAFAGYWASTGQGPSAQYSTLARGLGIQGARDRHPSQNPSAFVGADSSSDRGSSIMIAILRVPPVDPDTHATPNQPQKNAQDKGLERSNQETLLEMPATFYSHVKELGELKPPNDDPYHFLKFCTSQANFLLLSSAHLTCSQQYLHVTAEIIISRIKSSVRALKESVDGFNEDFERFKQTCKELQDGIKRERQMLGLIKIYRSSIAALSNSSIDTPISSTSSFSNASDYASLSSGPGGANGLPTTLTEPSLSNPTDPASLDSTLGLTMHPGHNRNLTIDELERRLDKLDNFCTHTIENQETRRKESLNYMEKYFQVLVLNDDLSSKWCEKNMRDTCNVPAPTLPTPTPASVGPPQMPSTPGQSRASQRGGQGASPAPPSRSTRQLQSQPQAPTPEPEPAIIPEDITLGKPQPCLAKFCNTYERLHQMMKFSKGKYYSGANSPAQKIDPSFLATFKFEKKSIDSNMAMLNEHILNHCFMRYRTLYFSFIDWCKTIQTVMQRLEKLRVFIKFSIERQHQSEKTITRYATELHETIMKQLEVETKMLETLREKAQHTFIDLRQASQTPSANVGPQAQTVQGQKDAVDAPSTGTTSATDCASAASIEESGKARSESNASSTSSDASETSHTIIVTPLGLVGDRKWARGQMGVSASGCTADTIELEEIQLLKTVSIELDMLLEQKKRQMHHFIVEQVADATDDYQGQFHGSGLDDGQLDSSGHDHLNASGDEVASSGKPISSNL